MRSRVFPLLLVAAGCALAAGAMPAWAWDGTGRLSPLVGRSVPPVRAGRAEEFRFHGRSGLNGGSAVVIWPDTSLLDTAPEEVTAPPEPPAPAGPEVIVLGTQPHGTSEPAVRQPLPDYGYVPGCRAIPNGYHCDLTAGSR